MKRFFSIAFPLACILVLVGCVGIKTTEVVAKEVNTLEHVTLTLDEVSAESAVFTITNNGDPALHDEAVSYGLEVGLHVEKNGIWYGAECPGPVESMALGLSGGEQDSYTVDWKATCGSKLPAGHYRLVKTVEYGYRFENHTLAAEFTIE